MKLEWLEYFTKITPGKSLRQTSQEIYLSQQTLSSIISSLENEIGCELLIRSKKGDVQFTPSGELLKNYALDFLKNIDNIKQKKTISGELHIAVLSSFARSGYLNKILSYSQYYPNINLSTHYTSDIAELIELLIGKNCEIALVTDTIIDEKSYNNFMELAHQHGLLYIPKVRDYFYIYIHQDLIKSKKSFLSDFNNLTCFTFTYKGADISATSDLLKYLNCTSQMKFEHIYEIYVQQLMNKNGYGFHAFKDIYMPKELVCLPIMDDCLVEFGMLVNMNGLSQIARDFIDFVIPDPMRK